MSKKIRWSFAFAVVSVALTIASTAFAFDAWTGPATPTQVWAGYTDGSVYVEGLPNKGCNSSLIQFDSAHSDPQKVHQLALAAFLSGRKLTCRVNNCTAGNTYQMGYACRITN